MKAVHFALSAAAFLSVALTSPAVMALEEASLNELGTKAGAWLDSSKGGSVGEFEVAGAKLKVTVVMTSVDAKDRPMRILSIDGAKGGHSCNGLMKDGSSWKSPGPSYSVSC